ncbi:MAG TPA: hypothetical protein VK553_03220 [Candidatus Nitrosopolaris rasttigaisensis]|nr:hypothetical protein [Candidatus Nitrosopolaris rasttigaisensis]
MPTPKKTTTKNAPTEKIIQKIERVPSYDEVMSELCRRSFYEFYKEFWSEISSDALVDNWHIKYLCDELQEVGIRLAKGMKKEKDYIINLPTGGTTKSSIISIAFPCFLWVIKPQLRIACAAYNATLSLDLATKSRNILQSPKFKSFYPEIRIKEDQNNKSNFANTNGGVRISTSQGAAGLGLHFDALICGDIQNVEEAYSEIGRTAVNEWYSMTFSTRKTSEKTVTIICQQRLHPKDFTSYCLSTGKEYKQIVIPGELNNQLQPKELEKFYVNGLMDVNRLNPDKLKELRFDLGTRGYAAQILQSP